MVWNSSNMHLMCRMWEVLLDGGIFSWDRNGWRIGWGSRGENTGEWVGGRQVWRVCGEREFKLKADVFIGGNGKVVGNRKENRIVDWKVLRVGSYIVPVISWTIFWKRHSNCPGTTISEYWDQICFFFLESASHRNYLTVHFGLIVKPVCWNPP